MVRQATPDDYDVIVRLSEGIYDGYVYVPDMHARGGVERESREYAVSNTHV